MKEHYLSIAGNIPLYHDGPEHREYDHQISRILFSTNKVCDADDELIPELFERRSVLEHKFM